jgi:unsaturated rhamnogalacturonyl hydrolase
MQLPFYMWRFGEEIALSGLLAVSKRLGDREPAGFVTALLRAYMARGVGRTPEEHVAPARELLFLHEQTGDSDFLKAAETLAQRHLARPTNSNGARLHRWDMPGWCRQIWVDCMVLDAPFLVHFSQITGCADYRREGLARLEAYSLLQDEETGLLRHAFEEHCGPCGQLWARGNGWALHGLVDTVVALPPSDLGCDDVRARLAWPWKLPSA